MNVEQSQLTSQRWNTLKWFSVSILDQVNCKHLSPAAWNTHQTEMKPPPSLPFPPRCYTSCFLSLPSQPKRQRLARATTVIQGNRCQWVVAGVTVAVCISYRTLVKREEANNTEFRWVQEAETLNKQEQERKLITLLLLLLTQFP